MYTMAAFLQASAEMMFDPGVVADDEMRRKVEDAREAMGLEPAHAAVLEDFVSGDMKYAGGTLKRVQ